jgi:protein phosphatase
MNLEIPELALVVLIGTSGSGKSTFARTHFKPTEIVSSDQCRALVSDDENDQSASDGAFAVLHELVRQRLLLGKLTVVDATNVQIASRKALIALAHAAHALPIAIVIDLPTRVCIARNSARADRQFGPHVIKRQHDDLRRALPLLKREGFHEIYTLTSAAQVDAAAITRMPMWTDRRSEGGPFDIIGDVHGCCDELRLLLVQLGYAQVDGAYRHPDGRRAVFLGDLVDRGPDSPAVLTIVMDMHAAGTALCVPGNHDVKLLRKLKGAEVKVAHGLAQTLEQLATQPPAFVERVREFLAGLVGHYVLDGGKLAVAHAGIKQAMQGRGSRAAREFALYGETTGETDEFGLPVRYNWAAEYQGRAMVVYGHTPVPEAEWFNNTINIDTGCVFGGRLSALRYPERELVQVDALREYAEPVRPLRGPGGVGAGDGLTLQQQHDDMLDLEHVLGRLHVQTRLMRTVIVPQERGVTALEVISRFAIDPKWLLYLPPTMAPADAHLDSPGSPSSYLEHPAEAFAYFAQAGVQRVLCEEKHMGSRAVAVVCRDAEAARRRFGVSGDERGVVYTRTGRRFFDDATTERAFLERLGAALTKTGWWEAFDSDWFCLDGELLPWSAKAQGLIQDQYAAVGAASRQALRAVAEVLDTTQGVDVAVLRDSIAERERASEKFVEAYRRYCWPVRALDDYKFAPFQVLASAGKTHLDQDHAWHMAQLTALCAFDPGILRVTQTREVVLTDADSVAQGVAWWLQLTGTGGEGMVVKPFAGIVSAAKGLVQPGIKVRGSEYLRIIYGPDYDTPTHLTKLRQRSVQSKRRLALREFALGVEALERFVQREPLARVHECVFAVLALESEPMDPRL